MDYKKMYRVPIGLHPLYVSIGCLITGYIDGLVQDCSISIANAL